jgi:outer membrane immunogenic protein
MRAPGGRSTERGRVGWTAGAGVEYAFTNNWIFGVEWLYYNLGSHTTGFVGTGLLNSNLPAGSFVRVKQTFDGNEVRARLSYKF